MISAAFRKPFYALCIGALALTACKEESKKTSEETETQTEAAEEVKLKPAPNFNADSAYAFVEKQVKMGPRVPGSPAHARCADFFVSTLKRYGAEVSVQNGSVRTFDNKTWNLKNVIASFNPKASRRIMLSSHWDTRPFADQDSDKKNSPIDGANDGASSSAILLEIARILSDSLPANVGVDLFFWDLEDYGQPENSTFPEMKDSYCLGSQFWAKNRHKPGYTAAWGINMDMVGAPNAEFVMEEVSIQYAGPQMARVWSIGQQIGYGKYFLNLPSSAIVDDHYYINSLANIPMIDIIHRDRNTPSGFGAYWHTHRDNLSAVSKETLKAVGQTVLTAVWNE